MFAAGLSELRRPGGHESGVQTHHAPDPGAAPGQVSRDGGRKQLPLQAGVSPHCGGLHLRPTRHPTPTMSLEYRRQTLPGAILKVEII